MMLAYIHEKCGQPAFLLTKRPERYSPAKSESLLHLDGQQIQYGERRACDSCGHRIESLSSDNIRTMI